MASEESNVMTSEAKEEINVLIGSGLQVLNAPEDCLCSSCGIMAVFHFTNSCSHLYCRSCYFSFKRENRICRKCRTPIGGKTLQNDSIDSIIANLKTECTNKNLGCNDVVALRDLLEHTDNCKFSRIKLGSEEYSKRTITYLENIFDSKLQKLANDFSTKLEETTKAFNDQLEATANTIYANVEKKFETLEAKLLNLLKEMDNCRDNALEKRMASLEKNLASRSSGQLKETCDNVDAALRNIETVDNVFLQRSDWFSNELNKRNETVDQLTVAVDAMKSAITKLSNEKKLITENSTGVERSLALVQEKIDSPVDFLSKQEFKEFQQIQAQHMNCTMEKLRDAYNGTHVWKIEEFSKKMIEQPEIYSEYFYSNEYGYKIRVMMQFNEDSFELYLCLESNEWENHIPAIFHHKCSHFILDQSDRQEKIHISRESEPNFRSVRDDEYMRDGWRFTYFCSYELLERYKNVYLQNDQLLLKTVVDPALDYAVDPLCCQGVLSWKVNKYQKIKRESLDEICSEVWSDSFYSSEFGYRMRVFLEFAGDMLFMRLKILCGQFDDSLPDIFAHKVTFSILDQTDHNRGNSLRREDRLDPKEVGEEKAKKKMNSDYYRHSVVFSVHDFEKIPFLVDDSILIHVVVEPI